MLSIVAGVALEGEFLQSKTGVSRSGALRPAVPAKVLINRNESLAQDYSQDSVLSNSPVKQIST